MLTIVGKPILFYCIDYLINAGIKDIGIVLSPHTGPQIEATLAQHKFTAKITFIYQDQPLGLGHAVYTARDYLKDADDFTVLLGDNLFDKDLKDIINVYHSSKADSLILLKEVERPYDFGVAQFDSTGKIQKLVEKPTVFVSKHAMVGVYIFNQKIFNSIAKTEPSARGELEITDAISTQVNEGLNVQMNSLDGYWFDTGTREGLLDANKKLTLKLSNKFRLNCAQLHNSVLTGAINCESSVIIDDWVVGQFDFPLANQ